MDSSEGSMSLSWGRPGSTQAEDCLSGSLGATYGTLGGTQSIQLDLCSAKHQLRHAAEPWPEAMDLSSSLGRFRVFDPLDAASTLERSSSPHEFILRLPPPSEVGDVTTTTVSGTSSSKQPAISGASEGRRTPSPEPAPPVGATNGAHRVLDPGYDIPSVYLFQLGGGLKGGEGEVRRPLCVFHVPDHEKQKVGGQCSPPGDQEQTPSEGNPGATDRRSPAPSPEPEGGKKGRRRRSRKKAKSAAGEGPPDEGEVRLKMCQEKVERVDRLYEALERISGGRWSGSDSLTLKEARLRQNKYYSAIRVRILDRKTEWLRANVARLQKEGEERPPPADLGLSGKARAVSSQVATELEQLRAMEHHTMRVLREMMQSLSADVPVFAEEVDTALGRVGSGICEPAKKAFGKALQTVKGRAEGFAATDKIKRGHLTYEVVEILERWLVDHFENPYPTQEEKGELVRRTGMSMGQINNWLSNARIRIWRPAVVSMGE